jgi:hypothetical protein
MKSMEKETEKLTNDQWIEAIQERYSGPIHLDEKKYSIHGLAQLLPENNETMTSFSQLHRRYAANIPKDMSTPSLIKEAYLKALHKIDYDIWWICVRDKSLTSYEAIIKKVTELQTIKLSVTDSKDDEISQPRQNKEENRFRKDADVSDLVQ